VNNWLNSFARHGFCGLNSVRYLAAIALLLNVLGVNAAESEDTSQLEFIFDHSGIQTHLDWVLDSVTKEAEIARNECVDKKSISQTNEKINELLSADALRLAFLSELENRLSSDQVAAAHEFMSSAIGERILEAETASASLDESEYEAIRESYKTSPNNTEKRTVLVKHSLADTGAVYFLSAINTEISSLVAVASACSGEQVALDKMDAEIKDARASEALYRTFMRSQLIEPVRLVYRDLSDGDIEALSAFAKTDAGSAYYTALIKGIRSLLSMHVETLQESLTAQ